MRSYFLALCLFLAPGTAPAAITGFLNNPGSNSTDWNTYVASLGLGVDTSVDFAAHPLGALDGTFYLGSNGITMSITAPYGAVVVDNNSVPQGTYVCPCSTGEGQVPFTRLLVYADQVRFSVSFATPVQGAGFFIGDKFDPFGTDPTTLAAFTGPDGTGTLLGTYSLPTASYQPGYQVFLGVASPLAEIGSIVLTDGYAGTGDGVNIDNFRITAPITSPEPASLALLAAGLAIMLSRRAWPTPPSFGRTPP